MEKSEQKEKMCLGVLLLFLQAAETALCRYVLGGTLTDILYCTLWMLLFGGIAVTCLMAQAKHFHPKHLYFPVVFLCVLCALPCALFYTRLRPMAVFYLGAMLIAALVDRGMGMVLVFYFCAAAMLKNTGDMEEAVSLLALGVVLCLLAGFLQKKQGILEVFLLAGIVTAILYFLRTSLQKSAVSYRTLGLALCSTAAVLLCALPLVRLCANLARKGGDFPNPALEAVQKEVPRESVEVGVQLPEEQKEEAAPDTEPERIELTPDVYETFLSPDAVLMARMQNEAKPLYLTSEKLAAAVAVAAGQVTADAGRCKVIAMYCEVGKLATGQEPAAAGTALMREAGMPAELVEDIAGINRKEPRLCTKEAAIVFLAVTAMKIWNHPKTRSVNITQDKVIDKVFTMLLNKGVLDGAGFSVKEYNQLRKSLKTELTFQL